jgi:hypothetical protein
MMAVGVISLSGARADSEHRNRSQGKQPAFHDSTPAKYRGVGHFSPHSIACERHSPYAVTMPRRSHRLRVAILLEQDSPRMPLFSGVLQYFRGQGRSRTSGLGHRANSPLLLSF